MSNENVNLNVQPGSNNGNGWITVTAPNTQQQYSFKYTGGDQNNGGLKTKVGDGTATINVSLNGNSRYSVTGVNFTADITPPQLSSTHSTDNAAVTDLNTAQLNSDYCVHGARQHQRLADSLRPDDRQRSQEPGDAAHQPQLTITATAGPLPSPAVLRGLRGNCAASGCGSPSPRSRHGRRPR